MGLVALQSHTDRHIADAHSLIRKHEHSPVCMDCAYASSWRAWPNTQAPSFSPKRIHRKSKKVQLKKKLMRHISCIPAQLLAAKAFTTVTQEGLTQLHRCWLSNSTWHKWKRSKPWTVVFNEHRLSQSNYWKYATHPVLLYSAQTCDFPNGIECSLASSQNSHFILIKNGMQQLFFFFFYAKLLILVF